MPWYAIALMLTGPCLLGVARLVTWTARGLLRFRTNPRPGYLDLTTAPERARKEHA